ncbi:hypothetical protein [Acaryochloris marina]|uniref:Bacterial conjugation TrbI-like protein n=1 Tax=Acaryochloris marina (strain MBIC 11017) TaxID=329726 RepID=A8ZPN7_ACAM1|nr:hypothetical protein [Acaryochloris marina]ABW32973.1 hypothetical protein AM1_E0204 [Acaryochloris marina MBIC11017]
MAAVLDKWKDTVNDGLEDESLIDTTVEIDDGDQDYTVRTQYNFAENPKTKIILVGACVSIVLILGGGLLLIMNSSSAITAQQQQQFNPSQAIAQSALSPEDKQLLQEVLKRETFNRQDQQGRRLANKNKGVTAPSTLGQPSRSRVSVTPQRTVTPPRVIYRPRPVAPPPQQPQRQFSVQRPVAVAAQAEVDDPNAGYFTAPLAATRKSPVSGQRKLLKLTKSEGFKTTQKPVKLFNPPTQIASASKSIPQPQPRQLGNLSGNLKNPYMNQIVATASQAVIPVDTAVSAQVVNRVSWIPENPKLAKGKVVRLKLQDDLKDGAGDVVASRGTIALGFVTQATEQGLISVNLTKIGSKFVQSGAVEIHQDGDPTMIAKLETKGGNSNWLKTALDIGIGGVQTWASNRNNPTSQTSFTNGNQTFLSTNNSDLNSTAAFVEGATGRIGERLRQSVNGLTQTKIGVFRFGGKRVQLYFVREVRL